MHKRVYTNKQKVKAIRSAIVPEVWDDVACWDDDSIVITCGCFLGYEGGRYKVLNYYDEPDVFTWDHAVKIEV